MNEQATKAAELVAVHSADVIDLASAVNFGRKQVLSAEYKGIPIYALPKDMEVHTLEKLVEQQLSRPYKLEQKVNLTTQDSFIEYFNRYATESSTIFVNDNQSYFTAVLDYHDSPGVPAWKKHIAHYSCPQTKEWNSWIENNNVKMSQEEFALFIEDNVREIVEPNGADMLQIASTLKAKNNVDFKSSTRLDNGEVQFLYSETIQGQAGAMGQLSIPEKFKLVMSPYLKGAAYQIEARLRYRINPSGLQMWYTLIRPHVFADDAFTDIVAAVREKMTTGHLVHGSI